MPTTESTRELIEQANIINERAEASLQRIQVLVDALKEQPRHPQPPRPSPCRKQRRRGMSLSSRPLRLAFTANRLERMTRNPGRYARNRAKSKAMSRAGVWKAWRRWWRA
jgi:hypothetical protein